VIEMIIKLMIMNGMMIMKLIMNEMMIMRLMIINEMRKK
jgi:hypothetical protein